MVQLEKESYGFSPTHAPIPNSLSERTLARLLFLWICLGKRDKRKTEAFCQKLLTSYLSRYQPKLKASLVYIFPG